MRTEHHHQAYEMAAIILSCLQGEINEKEQAKLDAWLEESPQNRRLFAEILDEKRRNDEIRRFLERKNPEEAWKSVVRRYGKKRSRHLYRYLEIAAAVLVFLGTALWVQVRNEEVGTGTVPITAENIHPGRPVAKLTIGNGSTYLLDSIAEIALPNTSIRNGNEIVFQGTSLVRVDEKEEKRYNKLEIPRGGEYRITLPDGTQVFLNSETEFSFPEDFVGSKERVVYLTGEAFFKVAKNEAQPFIVKCSDYAVKVLGTAFNISHYPDDSYSHTTLAEGKVEIDFGTNHYRLEPGQQALLKEGQMTVREVNVENYATWMDENFRFESESMEEILKRIARWYAVDIFYANPGVKDYHFTGYLPRYSDIGDILELLSLTTNVQFEIKNTTVVVKKK